MRILVLTNMYPPHAWGGYELSCQDVVQRWREAGHEVVVLTSTIRLPGVGDGGEPGIRRELELYWEDHEILNPSLARRWAIERRNARVLERAISDHRPDVVSAWAMGAMSFGLLSALAGRGVPVVTVICDEWPIYGPEVDAWLRPLARRPALGRVVGALTALPTVPPPLDDMGPACFVSRHLLEKVRDLSQWRFPHGCVVHSGVHLDEFPLSRRQDDGWKWRILYVGRIDPRKGVPTAVRALAALPEEATLAIHGGGDERYLEELRLLATSLGVGGRVTFTSSPRHELARVYGQADVVVFPSIWEEPFGLVPLEAMACGTPVVATAVGGAAEFLRDGANCLLFAPDDVDSLVRAVGRLAVDPALRRKLTDEGLATAAGFGVDRLARVLEDCHAAAAAGSVDCPGA